MKSLFTHSLIFALLIAQAAVPAPVLGAEVESPPDFAMGETPGTSPPESETASMGTPGGLSTLEETTTPSSSSGPTGSLDSAMGEAPGTLLASLAPDTHLPPQTLDAPEPATGFFTALELDSQAEHALSSATGAPLLLTRPPQLTGTHADLLFGKKSHPHFSHGKKRQKHWFFWAKKITIIDKYFPLGFSKWKRKAEKPNPSNIFTRVAPSIPAVAKYSRSEISTWLF